MALCREFSKVNGRHWLWIHRNNPLPLKILATSFIIAGLDPLITAARFSVESLFHHQGFCFYRRASLCSSFSGAFSNPHRPGPVAAQQCPYRRLVWSAHPVCHRFHLGSGPPFTPTRRSSMWARPRKRTSFWASKFPSCLSSAGNSSPSLQVAAGLYILNQPSIRALFRRDPKTKIA